MTARMTKHGREAAAAAALQNLEDRMAGASTFALVDENGEHMADVARADDGTFSSGWLRRTRWRELWLTVDGEPFVEVPTSVREMEPGDTLTFGPLVITP